MRIPSLSTCIRWLWIVVVTSSLGCLEEFDGVDPSTDDHAVQSGLRDDVPRPLNYHSIKACYERQLREYPDLEGLIEMRWVIQPDGSTGEIEVLYNDTGNEELARCIHRRIHRFLYDETWAGEEITYPYRFFSS